MILGNAWFICYDNDLDAYVPEVWAVETLRQLENNMVIGSLVHRDYSPDLASMGDIVNVTRPGTYKAKRKATNDDVTVQDSDAESIPVKLDQHVHVSFLIRDGEESLAFKSIIDEHLKPASLAMAEQVDRVLLNQVYRFLANAKGELFGLTSSNAVNQILQVREVMNVNKAPVSGRNLIWTPRCESLVLENSTFHEADKVGDGGLALREASMGRKLGFSHYMAQQAAGVLTDGLVVAAALVDNGGGYAAGETVVHIDTAGSSATVGAWVTFADDMVPHRITALGSLVGEDIDITISPALVRAVANDTAVTIYVTGAVNQAVSPTGYAAGYAKKIVVDGFTSSVLQVGQMVSFGTASPVYGIMDVETSSGDTIGVELDRPLELAIANNDVVGVGPAGDYNFAFTRDAIAMVIRPLALPRAGSGAVAGVADNRGLAMRSVITYDGNKQGHLVTLDFLMGVAMLDVRLGAVLLG